ncbi:dienelactone hydrolase [Desulfuromonas soudanensis]|uniref:Dienelactone hydrolase n=1 Tax=Desulfuromonas soudanensis TaxID=1603606 RepID=A0A0M4CYU8_9BACT|nr:dienelactone hydrolase family protein [Desulfuromonas soudanensis]ALC15590.1 dienelactone hydrolase [Desulfuromonas soudanensis]
MKRILTLFSLFLFTSTALAAGTAVTYEVDGQPYEGYYVTPAPGAPLVFLVHDWDGLTDYEVKRSEMLADMGYAVFAVDLFGKGVRPTTLEEKQKLTGALYGDRARMRALLQGGLNAAKKQGGDVKNAVAIGYCFGGAAILELARSGADLKGFVAFHGGLTTPEGQDYRQTKGTLLVLHGTADSSVSMEDFATLAVALETAGVTHEMTTYSGAPHAFTVFGSDRYRKDADEKSWKRFGEFLRETLR